MFRIEHRQNIRYRLIYIRWRQDTSDNTFKINNNLAGGCYGERRSRNCW